MKLESQAAMANMGNCYTTTQAIKPNCVRKHCRLP